MKKSLLALIGILFSTSLFSQELILLKTFKINGIEEEKKVKIIGKEEYTYSGKPRIISKNGKVKEIFFYDEKDLLVKKWSGTWNNHFDLLSFEYDIEQNIAERKVAEGYEETLYFYDTQNRLIRTTVTNSNEFCNYIYDEKGNLIQKENEQGIYKYEYNSNNQIIYTDCYGKIEFYFEYDDKGREISCKELDDNNIYEYFYTYDDEKRTMEFRRTRISDGNVIYDLTGFDEYDSNGNLVHSKHYSSIITSENKLLNAEIKETYWKYYENKLLLHTKTIFREKETNTYEETFCWDNGNLNTVIIYEEVE